MERIIETIGKKIYETNGHHGYVISWNLMAPLCKKWSRNRDPDAGRVAEILDFHKQGGYIPRIIHLAEVPEEGLVCYDGNHRREVFSQAETDLECIVDVMFGACQRDVYQAFHAINKSVQLPAIFLEETENVHEIRNEILQLVKTYEKRYKPFVSASSRYHAPHFNRDAFIDNIDSIYKAFQGAVSIPRLAELLETLNMEYAMGNLCRPHTAYSATVIKKCQKHGFWLFLERTIPFQHIEKLLSTS